MIATTAESGSPEIPAWMFEMVAQTISDMRDISGLKGRRS